jgi:phenylalanyl-tRNA synthetase beta chain
MKISLNWISKYVTVKVPPEELATKLTLVGLEVENVEYLGAKYKNFVVGKINKVEKHPNADKLTVCDVSIGDDDIKVVCGAPNVEVGQKVVLGLPGAVVPRDQHDPEGRSFTLSKISVRGFISNGMICSEYELDLGEDKNGIMLLPQNASEGTELSEYLGLNDVVFEIGITPNRPDCLSHIGIAREIAAALNEKLKIPDFKIRESKDSINKFASVVVKDKENCQRYTARVLKGIKVGQSPVWLQNHLSSVGIRPINNIVDVTNFVLMETGHPLHAFDYDKITNHMIIVRKAREGEHFTTLDEKGRELKEGMLLICDAEKPIALAGIMGGLNSEISESTVNILLESAYFNPRSIRKTSKLLGLSSHASQRFERGVDPNITAYAVDRAAQLIYEISGGEILKHQIDIYPRKIKPRDVDLNLVTLNNLLGTELTFSQVRKLLNKIGFISISQGKKKSDPNFVTFEIPTFRPDIEREIDLIEETARLFGYDNIETKTKSNIKFSTHTPVKELNEVIREKLVGSGFNEIITNSLQKPEYVMKQWLPEGYSENNIVKILNPISREMSAMRTSLIPSMLEVVRHNIYQKQKNLCLFEYGKVYFRANSEKSVGFVGDYFEKEIILVCKTGLSERPHWDKIEHFSDIFDLKGVIEDVFDKILLDKYQFIPYSISKALFDVTLKIEIKNVVVGYIGKVYKEILKSFDIEQDVFLAELDLSAVKNILVHDTKYKPVPNFPMVVRDLAFVIERSIPVGKFTDSISLAAGKLLKSIELFDLYTGDQIDENKKSCAFSLQFISHERTLTENEIEQIIDNIVQEMQLKYNAVLRSKN